MAEDNAIEDTIFHMTRALDAERIDLDRFVKVGLPRDIADALVYPVARSGTVYETRIDRAYTRRHGTEAIMVIMHAGYLLRFTPSRRNDRFTLSMTVAACR